MHHFDVEHASIQAYLEEIYVRLAEACGDLSGCYVGALRTLYGLKQAGRAWNAKFVTDLEEYGFEHFFVEPCVLGLI